MREVATCPRKRGQGTPPLVPEIYPVTHASRWLLSLPDGRGAAMFQHFLRLPGYTSGIVTCQQPASCGKIPTAWLIDFAQRGTNRCVAHAAYSRFA
jgi:hypothetical protein